MEHTINDDREFFGYTMRTRRHYHDDHILRTFFQQKEQNHYRIPDKLKTAIDIGANIGCVSILCAEKGARVFAYEPATDNFETLKHNIEINGYSDKVTCIKKAVGTPGKSKLYIHPTNSGATSLFLNINNGAREEAHETVDVISIKDVFEENKMECCDFLKMDCEGGEDMIIRDLNDELVSKISQISLEFHDKKKTEELKNILLKWYNPIRIGRHEWVFIKK